MASKWEAIDNFNRIFNKGPVKQTAKPSVKYVYVKVFQNGVKIVKTVRVE